MLNEEEVIEKVEKIAAPIVDGEGLGLYDVEFKRESGGWVLRVYIYRPEGNVSIDDCVRVSRQLNVLLDVEDLIPHSYNLEVSSPGLTRTLKKISHFEKSLNNIVKLKTKEPIEGKKVFKGLISKVAGNKVYLIVDSEEVVIDYENISSAKLEIEI